MNINALPAQTDNLAFMEPERLVAPAPWVGHIPFVFWLVGKIRPRVVVELGTHTGNSYNAICQVVLAANTGSRCYAIDTWHGDPHAGIYGAEVLQELRSHHDPRYGAFSTLLQTTFDEARGQFADGSIDLLHIDGLHTYEAVRHDFETWRGALSSRGVVMFHDTCVTERDFGVYRLWEELSRQYPSINFRHSNGLGVLLVGTDVDEDLLAMTRDPAIRESTLQLYEALGRSLERRLELRELNGLIGDRERELAERGAYIEQKHTEIRVLDASLESALLQQQQQQQKLQSLQEQEERLREETQLLAQQRQKEQQQRETEQQQHDLKLHEQAQAHAAISAEADGLRGHRNQLLDDAEISRVRLSQMTEAVRAIRQSTSWRVTRPLRAVGHKLQQGRKVWKLSKKSMAHPRSYRRDIRSMREAWHEGGWPAVRQWLEVSAARASKPVLLNADLVKGFRADMAHWPVRPRITVLMATFNTEASVLQAALDSLHAQIYPHWELCVVDDNSTQPQVRRILQSEARIDARIRPVFASVNRGVSAATNSALAEATGDMCVLMDHDDLLEPQALFRMAEAFVEDAADFIYSDEVIVDADGEKVLGYTLRPAFSPEYLRGHPYIVHLCGFRTSLLRRLGGLNTSLTISQDYDLLLRVSEVATRIAHIPEVLYRWRTRPDSVGHQKKAAVVQTSSQVLDAHLKRIGLQGHVQAGPSFNFFDCRYALTPGLKVAIVIPTKNRHELVRQCVESIEISTPRSLYEIFVVNHDSDEPESQAYFEELARSHHVLPYSGEFNFSKINNAAVAAIPQGFTHYLFCNNDVEAIENGWLERMLELGQREKVGAVGARLLYPDGRSCQHAGVCIGMFGAAEHYGKFLPVTTPAGSPEPGYMGTFIVNREMSAVTAACMLVRREVFEKVGGFDDLLAVGFGDVDLCLRIRQADFQVLFCAHATLIHHESLSRGKSVNDPHPEDSALFRQRWQALVDAGDDYFSPNLSSVSTRWDVVPQMKIERRIRRRLFERVAVDR